MHGGKKKREDGIDTSLKWAIGGEKKTNKAAVQGNGTIKEKKKSDRADKKLDATTSVGIKKTNDTLEVIDGAGRSR